MEPLEPGKGIEFESKIVGGVVPKEYIKPIEEGVREAAESGVLAGYPVIDFKATLVDGSYHEVDSSEMAFKIAGSMAFKEGCRQAKSVILEMCIRDRSLPFFSAGGTALVMLLGMCGILLNISKSRSKI